MKKFFLSLFVVLSFAGYALKLRGGSDDGKVSVNANIDTTSIVPETSTNSDSTTPSSTNSSETGTTPSALPQLGTYKNGTYTGSVNDAYYGNVQVKATIQQGNIADVTFLDYPRSHQTSVYINTQAMPYLKSEAIQAQSANVNTISGATLTSAAFRQSLQTALNQAR